MIRLHALGRLDLANSDLDATALLRQPKRLAVLLYLATMARRAFLRRDQVATVFWPELSQERARHALRQAVHVLRKELGDDVIRTRGDEEISLDAAVIWCDVAAFQQAIETTQYDAALTLYEGELLPGFHLPDAPEFERWLEDMRGQLREQALKAAVRATGLAQERGDRAGALQAAEKAVAIAPGDERSCELLMTTRVAAGDVRGALQAYEDMARRNRSEYELEPSARLQSLATSLRRTEAQQNITLEPAYLRMRDLVLRLPGRLPLRVRVGAIAALVLLLGAGLWRHRVERSAGVASSIAVLPFVSAGNAPTVGTAQGLAAMLSARLDGTGGLHSVAPELVLAASPHAPENAERAERVARRLRAHMYVTGLITYAGAHVQISATAYRRASPAHVMAQATVEGRAADVPLLLDRLTEAIVASSQTGANGRLRRLAAQSTSSLPAMRAFLNGEAEFQHGRFARALKWYENAAANDSTFALAWYRLAMASMWSADYAFSSLDAATRAARSAGALAEHDRLLLEAWRDWRRGRGDLAEQKASTITATYPDNLEAWYLLGEARMHYGPLFQQSMLAARPAFERVLQLDPDNYGALWHLALLAAFDRRPEQVATLSARMLALRPDSDQVAALRTLSAFALQRPAEQGLVIDELRTASEARVIDVVWRTAVYARNVDGAARVAELLTQHANPYARTVGHVFLAHFEAGRGRYAQADAQLRSAARTDAGAALVSSALIRLLPDAPVSDNHLRALRDSVAVLPTDSTTLARLARSKLVGLLDVRLGRVDAALARAAALRGSARGTDSILTVHFASELRASALAQAGRYQAARAVFDSLVYPVWYGMAVSDPRFSDAAERFAHAEVLSALGSYSEALRVYDSLEQFAPHDLRYQALVRERRRRITSLAGGS